MQLSAMFSPGEECLDWVFGWLVNGARREGRGVGMGGSCATGRVGICSRSVGLTEACRGPCWNSNPLRRDGSGECARRGVESRYLQPYSTIAFAQGQQNGPYQLIDGKGFAMPRAREVGTRFGCFAFVVLAEQHAAAVI